MIGGGGVFGQAQAAQRQAGRTLGGLSQFRARPMRSAGASPTVTYGGATVAPTQAYGGAEIERTMLPQAATLAEVERYGGATISPIERATASQLGDAATMQGVGAVQAAQAPSQIAVNQLAATDLSSYMSPYQQQVIEAGQSDIERQRQLASENLAAQAQKAGAFGGSRQATRRGFGW